EIINKALGFKNDPVLISNACISGVVALSVAKDYIEKGLYKNVIVSGADIASEFVISGFQSFKAIGSTACKPFDKNRDGITLGEGASTIIVSDSPLEKDQSPIILAGTGISNDANHISGPSRTGDGLALSISKAMQEAGIEADSVDYISAHGTATPYNDEMESKALELAKVNHAPLNSCKAYFGHTLGAAGLLESSALIHSMRSNIIFPSIGCDEIGVSGDINLITEKTEKEMYTALKTASGFGGCNASAVFTKVLK
ncbi:MAG: beta-ketoacyl synthase, partial [Marinilabiliales bacterium]